MSNIHIGAGEPKLELGESGDIFINPGSGDLYKKVGERWALKGNLKGPTGLQGAVGPQGPQGIQGPQGFQGSGGGGAVYQPTVLSGPPGPAGPPGPTGARGEPGTGSNIYVMRMVPPEALGVSGDLYLNEVNGDLYNKKFGVWNLATNLVGAMGATGPVGPTGPVGSKFLLGHKTPSVKTGNIDDVFLDTKLKKLHQKSHDGWNHCGDLDDTQPVLENEFSLEETKTNKIWMNAQVYRKVFIFNKVVRSGIWTSLEFNSEILEIVGYSIICKTGGSIVPVDYELTNKTASFKLAAKKIYNLVVILEYTR